MLPARLQGFVPQKMMVENKAEKITHETTRSDQFVFGFHGPSGAKKNCFYALMGNTVDGSEIRRVSHHRLDVKTRRK